jgi:hypothetical protein
MALKRIAKILIVLSAVFVILLGGLYVYLFHYYMPRHFREEILPRLTREAGIRGFSGNVRRVGAFGADLGELVIGDAENPALKVHSVKIKYNFDNIFLPRSLKISKVTLEGVELSCMIKQKKLEINNVDLQKFISLLKENFIGRKTSNGPFANAVLKVSDGILKLDWQGARFLVPFEIDFKPQKKDWTVFETAVKLEWKGKPFVGNAVFNLANSVGNVNISTRMAMPRLLELAEHLNQFKAPDDFQVNGEAKLTGDLRLSLRPLRLREFALSGTMPDAEIKFGRLVMRNRILPSGLSVPIDFELLRKDGRVTVRMKNVFSRKPVPMLLPDISLEFPSEEAFPVRASGIVEFDLSKIRALRFYGLKPISNVNARKRFAGTFNRSTKAWNFSTDSEDKSGLEKCVFAWNDMTFFCDLINIKCAGYGQGFNGQLSFSGDLPRVASIGTRESFRCENGRIETIFKLLTGKSGEISIGENVFSFELEKSLYVDEKYKLKMGHMGLKGKSLFRGGSLETGEFSMVLDNYLAITDVLRIKGNDLNISTSLEKQNSSGLWDGHLQLKAKSVKGKADKADFEVNGVDIKSFASLARPVFDLTALKTVNSRLKAKKAQCQMNERGAQVEDVDLGLSLRLNNDGRVVSKSLNGTLSKLSAFEQKVKLGAWKISLFGSVDTEKKIGSGKRKFDFIERIEAGKLALQKDDMKYLATSGVLRLEGDFCKDRFVPSDMKLGITLPAVWGIGNGLKVKGENAVINTELAFADVLDFSKAIRKIDLQYMLPRVAGTVEEKKFSSNNMSGDIKIAFLPDNNNIVMNSLRMQGRGYGLALTGDGWKGNVSSLECNVKGRRDNSGIFNCSSDVSGKTLHFTSCNVKFTVPQADFVGVVNDFAVAGRLKLDNAGVSNKNSGIKLSQINVDLPVAWPDWQAAGTGRVKVGDVNLRGVKIGVCDVNVTFDKQEILLRGNHASTLLPGAGVYYFGRVVLPPAPLTWELDFSMPDYTTSRKFFPGQIFPAFDELSLNGTFGVKGVVKGSDNSFKADGSIKIENADISVRGMNISKLNGQIAIADFKAMRSAPSQKLTFKGIKYEDIFLENGETLLTLKSSDSVYLERVAFDWFGGRLTSLKPFLLSALSKKEQKGTFKVDGMMLAPLMQYIGMNGVDTGAAVYGVMPFVLNDGNIEFEDAELSTKTGKGGDIKLLGLEKFADDSPEERTMDMRRIFVCEALKNFKYDWLSLVFSSRGKVFFAKLKTRGVPEKTLPFSYDERSDSFRRISPGQQGLGGDMTIEADFKIPRKK